MLYNTEKSVGLLCRFPASVSVITVFILWQSDFSSESCSFGDFTEAFNVTVNLRACLSPNSILASLTHEHTHTDICLEDVGQHDVNNLVCSLTAA